MKTYKVNRLLITAQINKPEESPKPKEIGFAIKTKETKE